MPCGFEHLYTVMILAVGYIQAVIDVYLLLVLPVTVAVIELSLLVYSTSEMMSPLTVCTCLVSGTLERNVTALISTEDQTAIGMI